MKTHTKQKKLVLFDIDGTLILSGDEKLRRRFEHVFKTVYGVDCVVRWELHEGTGDRSIFLRELSDAGLSRSDIEAKLDKAFEEEINYFTKHSHADYEKWLLPGAVDIVKYLSQRVHMGMLTGNLEAIAWRKLELIGLREYFSFGVFGDEADDRVGIAKLAHPRAKDYFGFSFNAQDVIVIGDTQNDILCARAIDARVIAVATGKFSMGDLTPYKPDLLVSSLEDPRILPFIGNDV